jgi:hypothetical protein
VNVARMAARGSAYRVLVGKAEGKGPLEDIGKDGGHSIKIVSLRNGMGTWTGFIWIRTGTGGRLCELRNATSAS